MTQLADILDEILTIPFLEGGRDESGCDCWGLCVILYKKLYNIDVDSYSHIHYSQSVKQSNSPNSLSNASQGIQGIVGGGDFPFIQVEEPRFGDFVLVNMLGRPVHMGFVIDENTMIHTTNSTGVSIENYRSGKWNRRIQSFHRHKHLA